MYSTEPTGVEEGEGLGKDKSGIAAAIKVTKKLDTKGGENFEFAWWDHVYNKVSSSVQVENVDGEVKVQLDAGLVSRNLMGIISTELLPVSQGHGRTGGRVLSTEQLGFKRALYGYFVKSFAGSMKVEKSFATKVGDEELFEACGRLTARKGARAEQRGKLERTGSIHPTCPPEPERSKPDTVIPERPKGSTEKTKGDKRVREGGKKRSRSMKSSRAKKAKKAKRANEDRDKGRAKKKKAKRQK
ncbi:hypothetical protein L0F63_005711 [Massospora cicadina]|nr:hypothetical protein L0F63_005711 [Massospora cicadina]